MGILNMDKQINKIMTGMEKAAKAADAGLPRNWLALKLADMLKAQKDEAAACNITKPLRCRNIGKDIKR